MAETIWPDILASLPTTIFRCFFPEISLMKVAYAEVNLMISAGVSPSPMMPLIPEIDLIKVMFKFWVKIGKFAA
jgi:hypothetical protein